MTQSKIDKEVYKDFNNQKNIRKKRLIKNTEKRREARHEKNKIRQNEHKTENKHKNRENHHLDWTGRKRKHKWK